MPSAHDHGPDEQARAAMERRRTAEHAEHAGGRVAVYHGRPERPQATADAVRRRWHGEPPHEGDEAVTARVVALYVSFLPSP